MLSRLTRALRGLGSLERTALTIRRSQRTHCAAATLSTWMPSQSRLTAWKLPSSGARLPSSREVRSSLVPRLNPTVGQRHFSSEADEEFVPILTIEQAVMVKNELAAAFNGQMQVILNSLGKSTENVVAKYEMVQSMLMSMVAELLQDHPEFKDMDEMSAYVKFNDLCAELLDEHDQDGELKKANDAMWAAILKGMYDTPQETVEDASITLPEARELSQMYQLFVTRVNLLEGEGETKASEENEEEQDVVKAQGVEMLNFLEQRENVSRLNKKLSMALLPLFEEYGFKGEEGYFLMMKCLVRYARDDIVANNQYLAAKALSERLGLPMPTFKQD